MESSFTLAHHPPPICHKILLALSLKYNQNPTSSHHLCCHHRDQSLICISDLDYCNSLLTDLPASTPDPPYIYFQHSSQSDPLKVNQIISLLCSKPCNGSPSDSEEKPVSASVNKAYTFGPHYLSTSFVSCPLHSTQASLLFLEVPGTHTFQGFEMAILPAWNI